ncbi:MAG: M3 family metallopeptidase, partial [Propionibacteriaceae bacterium]
MTNPLLLPSPLPYDLPDFANIRFEHFREALDAALGQQRDKVQAIIDNPDEPTFDNTIMALEHSGELLSSVVSTFYAYVSSDNTEAILDLEGEYTPKFSELGNFINLSAPLFARVKAVYDSRAEHGLAGEDLALVERIYEEMSLSGAALSDAERTKLAELNTTISSLQTEFGKRLLNDTNDSAVVFDTAEQLAGLSAGEIEACAKAAQERGLDGKFLVSLILPTDQPYLSRLEQRESRRMLLDASMARGDRDNAHNTNQIVIDLVRMRAQRAQLLGYPT